MPVTFLRNEIADQLSSINFKKVFIQQPHPNSTMKESLIEGTGVNVKILSEKEFEVKFSENKYFEVIATDFSFSLQKARKQRNPVMIKSSDLSIAWTLVTLYYSAFYSAIALARLHGKYNLFLKKEHCQNLLRHSEGNNVLDAGNYYGEITDTKNDYITIRFSSRDKNMPHDLTWRNLKQILSNISRSNLSNTKLKFYELLIDILDTQRQSIDTPNTVRNDWNYSIPNAYDDSYCSDLGEIKSYLDPKGRSSIFNWPGNRRKLPAKSNNAFSIVYIENLLFEVLQGFEDRILTNN
ncbi:MAG: hypothetical protein QMC62_03910 [Alteromonadaceae bacterium]|jgi:hypothetical protein